MSRLLTLAQVAELLSAVGSGSLSPDLDGSGTAVPDLLHSGWYTTDEVADLIGVDSSTLRRWRTIAPLQGPPFVRLTSRVTLYSVPDVQTWLSSRRIVPVRAA